MKMRDDLERLIHRYLFVKNTSLWLSTESLCSIFVWQFLNSIVQWVMNPKKSLKNDFRLIQNSIRVNICGHRQKILQTRDDFAGNLHLTAPCWTYVIQRMIFMLVTRLSVVWKFRGERNRRIVSWRARNDLKGQFLAYWSPESISMEDFVSFLS